MLPCILGRLILGRLILGRLSQVPDTKDERKFDNMNTNRCNSQ